MASTTILPGGSTMAGMNRLNGAPLNGLDHVVQSITDILTTPRGSRVMLRDYGISFPLIDTPVSESTRLAFISSVIQALNDWEPRVQVTRVSFAGTISDGVVELDLEANYLPNGQTIKLDGLKIGNLSFMPPAQLF